MGVLDLKYSFADSEESRYSLMANFAFCVYTDRKDINTKCLPYVLKQMKAHCVEKSSYGKDKCGDIVSRGAATFCHLIGSDSFCGQNDANYERFLPQSTSTTTPTTTSTTMKPVVTTESSFPAPAFFGGAVGGFIFGLLFMTIFLCFCKRKPESDDGLDAETGKRKKKSKTKTSSGTNTTGTTGTGTTNTGKTKNKKKDKKKKDKKVKKSKKSKNTTETNTATAY